MCADLLKIWKKLKPRIRAAVSALQNQVDEAFDPALEEIQAEYDSPVMQAVRISGLTMNVWSWYRTAPQGPNTLRSELESEIREWARKYRIEADWVINTAIESVNQWFRDPAQEERKRPLPLSVGMLGTLSPEDSEFRFRLPHAWEPTSDLPAEVRERIKGAFKKALNDWMIKTQNLVKELGFKETKKRSQLEKHIDWLIRQRVLDQGSTEIAKKDIPDKAADRARVTVDEGIDSASKLIGFNSA